MNPFDLPGPQFLALYAVVGAGVLVLLRIVKHQAEAGEPGRLPVSDPYVIAYLRGGRPEAVRLAVAVLVDRQLLECHTDNLEVRAGVGPSHGANELERAVLEECAVSRSAQDLLVSQRLSEIARRSYEPVLLQLGLFAGPEVRARRSREAATAIGVLVVFAAIKIAVGLARHRPVSFLVMSAMVFCVLALIVTRGLRTVRGDRILEDLTELFDALRHRATDLRPNTPTSELALLMAVFGSEALPSHMFPITHAFRPKNSSTSSCGTSSSSCGSGGGGCGGGGGGCGGCGS